MNNDTYLLITQLDGWCAVTGIARASVILYMVFVLSLDVLRLAFSRYLGIAAFHVDFPVYFTY